MVEITRDNQMGQIDEEIQVEITQDKMLGVISFIPPKEEGKALTYKQIKEAIESKGIIEGVDWSQVEEISKSHQYRYKYIIAKGVAPINGEDARIEFSFDKERLKQLRPTINEDGTADLRDLGAVKNVTKGAVLATKIVATAGTDGINVLGKVLTAKRGKDVRMPQGKGTSLIDKGQILVASRDGKLEYDGYNVLVNEVYTVDGDIDASIGNIDFVGSVVINGSVLNGFTVKAGGSVEVRGSVEDAVIISESDILITYGIQGTHMSKLKAKGNIVTKFIQNAHIEAEGSVTSEVIIQSTVVAGDSIFAKTGKGAIVGGKVCAVNSIHAKSIGSSLGAVTTLQIGALEKDYIEYKSLQKEIIELKETHSKIEQNIVFLTNKMKYSELTLAQKNMLKNFKEVEQTALERYEMTKQRYYSLEDRINQIQGGTVKCDNALYPGVRIMCGNMVKYIDYKSEYCMALKKEGEIQVVPLI